MSTDLENITRLEVFVDHKQVITGLFGDIFTSIQDNGKTLKVWVDTSTAEQHTAEYLKNFAQWFKEFENERVGFRATTRTKEPETAEEI